MKGHVILSHGSESGPQATKVAALSTIAEAAGWRVTRPDYRDLDARGEAACIDPRVERLKENVRPGERLVLGGSSMGSFVSGLASLDVECAGLFLLALPIVIPGYLSRFDAASVTTTIVHGWEDELCPVGDAIAFARNAHANLHVVPDTHRLSAHVEHAAHLFREFLHTLDAAPRAAQG